MFDAEVAVSTRMFAGEVRDVSGRALVPSVPPQCRPAADLKAYHILWEAEWQPQPPKDPLLLKHVDGPFFVVLAAWDLTR